MTFGAVQASFQQLRKRLAILVGARALPDITIEPPKGTSDENSFARLVAWAYVLLFEAGRIPLGFLRQLPPWSAPASALLPHVRELRTWTSHNLELDKAADIRTMAAAVDWFVRTCGVGSPTTPAEWEQCFQSLCTELEALLGSAVRSCDAFEVPVDRERLISSLNERLDRNWQAYRFDVHVDAAFKTLGYSGLDVVTFRTAHLDAWRKVVAASDGDAIQRNLALRIEADILQAMNNALPLTANELQKLVALRDKAELVAFMISLRAVPSGTRPDLINVLTQGFSTAPNAQGATPSTGSPPSPTLK